VEGRPNRRNNAAFSNFSDIVWTFCVNFNHSKAFNVLAHWFNFSFFKGRCVG